LAKSGNEYKNLKLTNKESNLHKDSKNISKKDLNSVKVNSINNIKKIHIPENININNIKNSKLINLINNIITVKLLENSLLHHTPDTRPLSRMKPDELKKYNKSNIDLPKEYKLYQNYPNPFNPVTKINYDLPNDSKVNLIIYDILGKQIVKLVNGEFKKAGTYLIEFDGSSLASGVYFYRIQAGSFVQTKKMVLIK